jgi:hypothetical protein
MARMRAGEMRAGLDTKKPQGSFDTIAALSGLLVKLTTRGGGRSTQAGPLTDFPAHKVRDLTYWADQGGSTPETLQPLRVRGAATLSRYVRLFQDPRA